MGKLHLGENMIDIPDLLKFGYFPAELPPPFNTDSFAEAVAGDFVDILGLPEAITSVKKSASTIKYNLARVGTLRRTLEIPNPIHQYRLSKEISNNWETSKFIIDDSDISISKPIIDESSDRALTRKKRLDEIPLQRAHYCTLIDSLGLIIAR